jgi:ribosome-associated protein
LRWDVAASSVLTDQQRSRIQQALAKRINRHGELIVSCDTHRSQHQNRQEALQRLAELVRLALRRRRRRIATSISPEARERRLQQKRRRAQVKRTRQRPDES